MMNKFSFHGLIGVSLILVLALLAIVLVFEILMFISVIRNKNISDNVKLFWIIGMILIHPFVAIAYFFTDYKKA
jgi:hypothetical protein